MPPIHDCPAASPVPEFDDAVPLTELEHDLLRSLDFAFGIAEGKIVNLTRRLDVTETCESCGKRGYVVLVDGSIWCLDCDSSARNMG
jgi:hypothetical protein